ncbi:MAG: nicotinamide-nucleotide amidase [Lamprobacter sp.]|uniref:nicotinamide-nucleotide amidase n=1 Tax=Lamprobacter sp. TaxID=3100796 RepID=UPI002B2632C3|nr:nicotinamide-nucleotide amidase [Lamprobacter sp.]MEA3641343.1 nicotinamide-nucleotide amidase [Lamprobacter sp.]
MTDLMIPDLDGLAAELGRRLQAHADRLVTAESCTGGWIAKCMTDVAGSSAWFERGFVTYSNEAKQDMLGVGAETLARHGAVSEPVVREMAVGALAQSRATLAVAVSGIAGPGGGTPSKPVGRVCIGWARTGRIASDTYLFAGDRDQVRRQSVVHALRVLIADWAAG